MRKFLCIAALFLGATAFADDGGVEAADPDAPSVGASLDKTEAFIGDRLTLTISAVAKAGIAVALPAKLDLDKLELLDRSDGEPGGRDLGDGRRSHRFVLGVAAYETGELEVPALTLAYKSARGESRNVVTAPVPLKIRGLMGADERQPSPQPLRPPRSTMVEDERVLRALRWGGVALAGAVVLAAGFLVGRRALRRRVTAAPEIATVKRLPEELALEQLRVLREAGNFSFDEYRQFSFAVAEIVRAYVGARYGFDSLELTTTELLDELSRRGREVPELIRFLADTDLVKFAKAGSTDEEAVRLLDVAERIVVSTTPKPEPEAKSA